MANRVYAYVSISLLFFGGLFWPIFAQWVVVSLALAFIVLLRVSDEAYAETFKIDSMDHIDALVCAFLSLVLVGFVNW